MAIKSRNIDKSSVVKQETIWFDPVASVGASAAVTNVIDHIGIPYRHKVVGAVGMAEELGTGGAHQFAVYNTEGTPAAVVSPTTISTANVGVVGGSILRNTEKAAGYHYTVRAVTPASTGSMTVLRVGIIIEKMDSGE